MTKSMEWSKIPHEIGNVIERHHCVTPIAIGAIARDLGLTVKKATLEAGISGEIKKDGDGYVIRVNRHDVKERQRFTIAHEISHYLLHRDKIGDGIVDDILYRSNLSDTLEAQANRLAADLIMPWHAIQERINMHHNLKDEALHEQLAKDFEVSTTAMKIRLGKL